LLRDMPAPAVARERLVELDQPDCSRTQHQGADGKDQYPTKAVTSRAGPENGFAHRQDRRGPSRQRVTPAPETSRLNGFDSTTGDVEYRAVHPQCVIPFVSAAELTESRVRVDREACDGVEKLELSVGGLLAGRPSRPPNVPGQHLDLVQRCQIETQVAGDPVRSVLVDCRQPTAAGVEVAAPPGAPRVSRGDELGGSDRERVAGEADRPAP